MVLPHKSMSELSWDIMTGSFRSNAQLLHLDGIVVASLEELQERVRAVRPGSKVVLYSTEKGDDFLRSAMEQAGFPSKNYLGFDVYTISDGVLGGSLAYGCKSCDKIIIGSPLLQVLGGGRASVECAQWSCGQCNAIMVLEQSSYREHSLM